ncbi:MAG: C39 family peptidase [Cyanobium sp.]
MSSSIPASAYVEHFDPELAHHRAWLLAVLERLVTHDPQALEEGGTLRRLWTEHQQSATSATESQQPRRPHPLQEESSEVQRSADVARGNPLSVPWFSQLDSSTDQARRMCFSSSWAMLLAFLRPGVLSGPNGYDQYLQRVRLYGDTTDAAAQIQALASYGIEAEFTKQASFRTVEAQIADGIPVPCGYLHRGPVEKPTGGGLWLIVVGHTPSHLIVHDPLGEADQVSGATIGGSARFCRYSRRNYRCAGLRLRTALDGGGRGQRLGAAG